MASKKTNKENGKEFRKRVAAREFDLDASSQQESSPEEPPLLPPLVEPSVTCPPTKKHKPGKRFRWVDGMVGDLIGCLGEQKTLSEFKGLDFEADLVELYSKVRTMMAERYCKHNEFGPVTETQIGEDLTAADLAKEKIKIEQDKKAIRAGYERIKAKVKEIRQSYRKAVSEGQRSGSGKVICDNWEELKSLWGGSPATSAIRNAVTSTESLEPDDDEDGNEDEDAQVGSESENDDDLDILPMKEKTSNPTPKFVDNKRKHMEKQLSASQRDQVYLNMAKEDLKLKQNILEQLSEATRESNSAFEKISQSIESVGKSIGDGLLALADAIGGNRPPVPFQYQQQHPQNYYHHQGIPNHKASTPNSSSFSLGSQQNESLTFPYYENL